MDHLLSASLIMSSHYPLAHRELLNQPPVVYLDMEHGDFSSPKHQPQHFAPPAPEYTSSPSLNSETDDDPNDGVFEIDMHEYIQAQQHQQQQQQQQQQQHQQLAPYESAHSPAWASMATPRAWVGEPQKVPSLEHDVPRVSFSPYATADGGVDPAAAQLYPTLADYLDDSAHGAGAAHSPPTTYMSAPALGGMDYYSAASPGYRYNASLQPQHDAGCDPRFVSPAPSAVAGPSSSPHRQDIGISFADVYSDPMHTQTHTVKLEPDTAAPPCDSDSGEDEKSESDDPSYVVAPRSVRSRSAAIALAAPRPTRTPAPEPIPNLTKKSRGRRVPTAASLYGPTSAYAGSSKNARTYVCKVRDCGKCFARSEHLKRHVRSIHTNEKPHRCPHPGCNKEFSRHDNLCQHMRVHRNYSAPKDGAFGAF